MLVEGKDPVYDVEEGSDARQRLGDYAKRWRSRTVEKTLTPLLHPMGKEVERRDVEFGLYERIHLVSWIGYPRSKNGQKKCAQFFST